MKYLNFSILGIVFLYYGCFSSDSENQPSEVIDHNTMLIIGKDSISASVLKLVAIKGDTIPYARVELNQKKVKAILNTLIGKDFDEYFIIGTDLYLKYRNNTSIKKWEVHPEDVKNISFFYVENDSVKFDFYSLKNKKTKTFTSLSDAYCDIKFMFLIEESDTDYDKHAIFNLAVKREELPNIDDLILVDKNNDKLYQRLLLFRKN